MKRMSISDGEISSSSSISSLTGNLNASDVHSTKPEFDVESALEKEGSPNYVRNAPVHSSKFEDKKEKGPSEKAVISLQPNDEQHKILKQAQPKGEQGLREEGGCEQTSSLEREIVTQNASDVHSTEPEVDVESALKEKEGSPNYVRNAPVHSFKQEDHGESALKGKEKIGSENAVVSRQPKDEQRKFFEQPNAGVNSSKFNSFKCQAVDCLGQQESSGQELQHERKEKEKAQAESKKANDKLQDLERNVQGHERKLAACEANLSQIEKELAAQKGEFTAKIRKLETMLDHARWNKDLLSEEAKASTEKLQKLEVELAVCKLNLSQIETQLAAQKEELTAKIRELETRLDHARRNKDLFLEQAKASTEKVQKLQVELAACKANLSHFERQLAAQKEEFTAKIRELETRATARNEQQGILFQLGNQFRRYVVDYLALRLLRRGDVLFWQMIEFFRQYFEAAPVAAAIDAEQEDAEHEDAA